jgi:putative transposase
MRKPYRSDLSNARWELIKPLIPPAKHGGRPRTVDIREVVNTLFYQARTGVQWEYLPHDLLPKSTVWDYFVAWQKDGTWQRLLDALRGRIRTEAAREETPSAVPQHVRRSHRRGAGDLHGAVPQDRSRRKVAGAGPDSLGLREPDPPTLFFCPFTSIIELFAWRTARNSQRKGNAVGNTLLPVGADFLWR